jgi:hypothetical protein
MKGKEDGSLPSGAGHVADDDIVSKEKQLVIPESEAVQQNAAEAIKLLRSLGPPPKEEEVKPAL